MPEHRWGKVELQVGGAKVPVTDVVLGVDYGEEPGKSVVALANGESSVVIEGDIRLSSQGRAWFLDFLRDPREQAQQSISDCAHRSRRVSRRRIRRLERTARIYLRQARGHAREDQRRGELAIETLRLLEWFMLLRQERRRHPIQHWATEGSRVRAVVRAVRAGQLPRPSEVVGTALESGEAGDVVPVQLGLGGSSAPAARAKQLGGDR